MSLPPAPVPQVPRKPRVWIAAIPGALLLAVIALVLRGEIGDTAAWTIATLGAVLALMGGYKILAWRGDLDYYDWYHGPGNPDRPSRAG
jgi:hypothetical protein